MSDFHLTEGDTQEAFRWALLLRTSDTTTQAHDLTAKIVNLYIRREGDLANLSEFDGLDISAGIEAPATDGNVKHIRTAPQAAQLTPGDYRGQIITLAAGSPQSFPNDSLSGKETFSIHVAESLA
jgi:hypothetical protein